jgi:hypothetical protein
MAVPGQGITLQALDIERPVNKHITDNELKIDIHHVSIRPGPSKIFYKVLKLTFLIDLCCMLSLNLDRQSAVFPCHRM